MRSFVFVFFCVVASSYGWGRGDLEKFGPFQLALHSGLIKCEHDHTLNLDVSGIDVYFYDFPRNVTKLIPIDDAAKGILDYTHLDKVKQFIVYVGGYKSHINKDNENKVRETFKNYPNSYLIIFDHSPYTNNNQGEVQSYARSVRYVHFIGKAIGDFLAALNKGKIPAKNMRLIGHSLGSQILGYAGEAFFNNTGAKLARITGLDPAGPCFSNSLTSHQIRSGVAEYVEVFHCNAGALGTTSVLADVDFFVNKKGSQQPSCNTPLIPGLFDSPKAARCSHKVCIDIWLATVKNPTWYTATKCDSYKKFKNGTCDNQERTIAGFWNPGKAKGVFYFSTEGY